MSPGDSSFSPSERTESAGQSNVTPCPLCRQSQFVDLLAARCTRCHPIRLEDLPPDFRAYARSGGYKTNKQLIISILIGPVALAIYYYWSDRAKAPAWLPVLFIIAIGFATVRGVIILRRKRSLLQRYYRLASVMQYVEPVDAELQYELHNQRGKDSRCYLKVCQLAPGTKWPDGIGDKIEIDTPPNSESAAVTYSTRQTLIEGYDPFVPPKLWGKVYFHPDRSGSAVISIKDGLFLSVAENN